MAGDPYSYAAGSLNILQGSWKPGCRPGAENKLPATCGDLGTVDSEPKAAEQCPERERLLRDWIECTKTVRKLQDEQLTAFRTADPSLSTFAEKIRLATATDVEACRAYYRHVALGKTEWDTGLCC